MISKILIFCLTIMFSGYGVASIGRGSLAMLLLSDTDNSVYSEGTLVLDVLGLIKQNASSNLEVTHVIATHHRSWQLLKKIPNACILNIIKTPERMKNAIYSKYPFTFYPPVRLITTAEHSFSTPFAFAQLGPQYFQRIGVVKGRVYTPFLDQEIHTYRQFLFQRGTINATHKLLTMLRKSRVDGFIEYASEVEDFIATKQWDFPIAALPIKGVNQPVTGYIGCAKTDEGQALIDAVDSAYLTPLMHDKFIGLHQYYFGDVEAKLLSPLIKSALNGTGD